MRSLLHEPLCHFLLLGAALFAAYGFFNRAPHAQPGEIIVSAGQIEHLAARFNQFRQRPPTPEEWQGLIDQYVREEILSREAMKLGLDQHDAIIRRRLQQKMEFVATDLATADEPTEAELAAWLAQHPDDFRQAQRFSFRHIYLNPTKRGEHFDADMAQLLADLQQDGAPADVQTLGDSFLLPPEFADAAHSAVAAQFGPEFAGQLARLQTSAWTGPIRSGYGVHLVLLTGRTESRLSALDEVRELVKRDVMRARRLEANRRFLEGLLAQYTVKIAWPKADVVSTDTTRAYTP
jgi:hypothetical protein